MRQHSEIKHFSCAPDINMSEAVSIDEALMTGTWIDVGTRYTTEDEAEPTYAGFKNWDKRSRGRNVTRPDRILANKLAMETIKSFQIVRESTLPGHLPLKLTFNTAPLKQRITVVKVPKPFPIEEIGEMNEEACSENGKRKKEKKSSKHCVMGMTIEHGAWSQQWQKATLSGVAVQAKVTNEKEEKEDVESQKRKNFSWQPALEKDPVTVQRPSAQESYRNQEDRQWRFRQN